MLWQLKVTAPPPKGEAGEGKIINSKLELVMIQIFVITNM